MKKYNYQVNKFEREKLREKGQFWTPEWIANAMVTYVAKESHFIFDPATGSGSFLKALKAINQTIKFYGIDIDSDILKNDIYNSKNVEVEIKNFLLAPPYNKFSGIVANPPYIRHHRLDKETKEHLKKLSIKILGFMLDGRVGYHNYFLIQSLALLTTNGRLAFIIPADTFEGVSAKKLWSWISSNYCIEAVVTFSNESTPFPNVDTNAIIVFIKNTLPMKTFNWIRINKVTNDDLIKLVESDFKFESESFTKKIRNIYEGLKTGFSRSPNENNYNYHLKDFAKVMRGIATGANEFFFLNKEQIKKLEIPIKYLKIAIGRTRDVSGDLINFNDISELEKSGRPIYLLSIENGSPLSEKLNDYLKYGEELGLNKRALIKQRTPWYKMEQRQIPEILFAYLGRRNSRFIKNEAKVLPLTGFLCVYPLYDDENFVNNLWRALNDPTTLENLKLVGKTYGSDAIKVEPRNLENLPLSDEVVNRYDLTRKYIKHKGQLNLFSENKLKYHLTNGSN